MANKVSELKEALGAGARANKYRTNFTFPAAISAKSDLGKAGILCKSASFPGMEIGKIEVFNQGRRLVIPGDTTYTNEWVVTFYQTEGHALRLDFINWMASIDSFQTNEHTGNPGAVMTEMSVEQLDSKDNSTVKYTFHNVWVSAVGEITVDATEENSIQEFEVTFTFTDWVVGDSEKNNPASAKKPTKNAIAS